MSPFDATNPSPPVRWGLAVKLFAILALLGAIAVLVTSVLGYLQARDALQEAIYNQLTSTRKSKVQQVETYFRTIRNELSQLAGSKEAIDAARASAPRSTSSIEPMCRSISSARSTPGTARSSCPACDA